MNAPFELRLDKAAFDHWLAGQDRKHEWKEGRVVQMPNVTRAHAKIVANVAHAIAQRIDRERWSVFTSDFGVEDAGWVRFPDVLVEPMDTDDKSRRSAAPVLLAEVLSPSSVDVDFTEKHDEYTSKPSLRAYPIFGQDAPICWVWQRRAAGEPFATQPVEIRGRTATIDIPALGLSLPLAEIYRGITTSEGTGVKTRDVELLIIEGWRVAPPDHWQSRWARHFKTARIVAQADRETPRRDEWVATIASAVDVASRPVVLVAHGLGVIAVAHAAGALATRRVAGAFLVAPPDLDGSEHWPATGGGFAPVPLTRLPFPARLIASTDDPYCRLERSQEFGAAWGADVSILANAGHIDTKSGHGPWPEGLLTFGQFLASLGPAAG